MHDKIEGGFFRYATTREWEIPHYEKMLEDNAELLAVYAEAHRTFPQAGYDRVVRDVVRWMDTVLWRDDVKAFAGSQDADEVYYELDAQGREKHGAPFVDKTLYTGWNALAVSAYVAAAAALGDDALEERAHEVDAHDRNADGRARRRRQRSCISIAATDRESPICWATGPRTSRRTLDEYETGKHPGALAGAVKAATVMRERLEDTRTADSSMRRRAKSRGASRLREKPIEDNAMAADALLRLAALTGDEQWRETARASAAVVRRQLPRLGPVRLVLRERDRARAHGAAHDHGRRSEGRCDGERALERGALGRRSGSQHPADRARRRRRASRRSSDSRATAPRRTSASARPAPLR